MTPREVAQRVVDSWDMEALTEFAVDTLTEKYESNQDAFNEAISWYDLEEGDSPRAFSRVDRDLREGPNTDF